MEQEAEDVVRALLEAAGIHPPEDEVASMIRSYPALRGAADQLFVPEASACLPTFLPTSPDREEE